MRTDLAICARSTYTSLTSSKYTRTIPKSIRSTSGPRLFSVMTALSSGAGGTIATVCPSRPYYDCSTHVGESRCQPLPRALQSLANKASGRLEPASPSGRAGHVAATLRARSSSPAMPPPCPSIGRQRSSTDNHGHCHALQTGGSAHPQRSEGASQARGGPLGAWKAPSWMRR